MRKRLKIFLEMPSSPTEFPTSKAMKDWFVRGCTRKDRPSSVLSIFGGLGPCWEKPRPIRDNRAALSCSTPNILRSDSSRSLQMKRRLTGIGNHVSKPLEKQQLPTENRGGLSEQCIRAFMCKYFLIYR